MIMINIMNIYWSKDSNCSNKISKTYKKDDVQLSNQTAYLWT